MKTIGVLALQGAFAEHEECLLAVSQHKSINIQTVRTAEELKLCDALVIPGGESTTMSLIAQRNGMLEPLREFVKDTSKPLWGTCAGLIFLSRDVVSKSGIPVQSLELVPVRAERNAFGRQAQSFVKECDMSKLVPGLTDFRAVFIRAPVLDDLGEGVVPLLEVPLNTDKPQDLHVVAALYRGNVLLTSFHPELGGDVRIHEWFVSKVLQS